MDRSEEKKPERAMLCTTMRPHSAGSAQTCSTVSCIAM